MTSLSALLAGLSLKFPESGQLIGVIILSINDVIESYFFGWSRNIVGNQQTKPSSQSSQKTTDDPQTEIGH
ncbi:MAG: hypothetical protein KGZ80_06190 [Methylomonas sp.]|nr:hypothetical protein [Methylomonas sp.]PPD20650.1 MAG: hypothetical protein CTY23_08145 [Methylomonas sp.]PPD36312.1 MAG: hypothetical protein CTY21_08340 [Methylomonas sp.]